MCVCVRVPFPFLFSFCFFFWFVSVFLKDKAFVWVQEGERPKQVAPANCFLPDFVVAEPSYMNWP